LSEPKPTVHWRHRLTGLATLVAVYLAFVYLVPRPESVKPEGWRLTGIFLATIAGSILRPIPGGALVLIAVTIAAWTGGLTLSQALSGYSDSTVWLVQAAFFISRSLVNTGLARRIALFFVRLIGHSSLGVAYALALSDTLLATIIPSNGARSGGVTLPIVRSIAELYDSHPGETAKRLGSFLFIAVFQGLVIGTAMFLTGQASNPLAAELAGRAGYPIDWAAWFQAGVVPGLVSLLVVPWIVFRVVRPEIQRTPEAAAFAKRELRAMGPLSRDEWILGAIFVSVCGLWMTSKSHGLDVTLTALLGAAALLLTGVLEWRDVIREETAWDIFIWYGGLLMMGKALKDTGTTTAFAQAVGSSLTVEGWLWPFAVTLLVYFFAHYGFASITAHLLAMYLPFVTVLVAKGAPVGLMAFSFAIFANLSAGLTTYGTTPAPMFFGHGYCSMRDWWWAGFCSALANLAIWSTLGFAWWRFLGIW
jgi:DASS family divalent anion:Na+ symporter